MFECSDVKLFEAHLVGYTGSPPIDPQLSNMLRFSSDGPIGRIELLVGDRVQARLSFLSQKDREASFLIRHVYSNGQILDPLPTSAKFLRDGKWRMDPAHVVKQPTTTEDDTSVEAKRREMKKPYRQTFLLALRGPVVELTARNWSAVPASLHMAA